jgi:hypothetical protein
MFKSKVFYVVLILAVLVAIFVYRKFYSSRTDNETAYFMQTTMGQPTAASHPEKGEKPASLPKLFGALLITSGTLNSQDMANGLLCIENANNLEKVDLFMPDMGHGSEPPKVTPANVPSELSHYRKTTAHFGCFAVESMQLFMPGTWQVRAFYKDGVVGIFTLDLKK